VRTWIPIVALGGIALWRTLSPEPAEPPPPDPVAEEEAAPVVIPSPAEAKAPGLWPPWGGEEAAAPPPDPVVHCVESSEEDGYVRQSECDRRGGRDDEPAWARTTPSASDDASDE